ncbi:MAG: amidohydrolase family protein, partial [Bacteroidales bacterium]|nr:amidohydrolase family protein [Bacteroidales bacterium]
TICLGTDSLSSNHLLNMVAEMKCIQENFPYIHLCEILTWACLNGAKALGIDGWCGSLKVGKRPGVVLLENIKDFRLTELSKSQRLA